MKAHNGQNSHFVLGTQTDGSILVQAFSSDILAEAREERARGGARADLGASALHHPPERGAGGPSGEGRRRCRGRAGGGAGGREARRPGRRAVHHRPAGRGQRRAARRAGTGICRGADAGRRGLCAGDPRRPRQRRAKPALPPGRLRRLREDRRAGPTSERHGDGPRGRGRARGGPLGAHPQRADGRLGLRRCLPHHQPFARRPGHRPGADHPRGRGGSEDGGAWRAHGDEGPVEAHRLRPHPRHGEPDHPRDQPAQREGRR